MKRGSRYKLIVLLFGLSLIGCGMTPEEKKTLETLHQIAAETPVYPTFKQVNSNSVVKSQMATLDYYYQAPAFSYGEVKSFYIKELTARGWNKVKEETYGGNTEGITFRKGEYAITVFRSSPRDQDWDYALSYTW